MKKIFLIVMFFIIASIFTINADMINGVEIYKNDNFPVGKTISLEDITGLPYGKMKVRTFIELPLEFENYGTPNGKGGYTYNAKVNHTWLGDFVSGFINPSISDSVFRITFPYLTPFREGDSYSFSYDSPITIIEKRKQMGSNAKEFDIYDCIYEGYLTVDDVVYPVQPTKSDH